MEKLTFVCDLETSGACPIRNGVISTTILACDSELNIIDEFSMKSRPPDLSPKAWSTKAEEIHKIPIYEVANYPSNDLFCYSLLIWLSKYKKDFTHNFVCHASASGWYNKKEDEQVWSWIDWNFLEHAFRKARFEDGSQMVWSLFKIFNPFYSLISTIEMGRSAGFGKNSLSEWAKRVGFSLNHHDARSDALCCLEVYKYLSKKNEGINYED